MKWEKEREALQRATEHSTPPLISSRGINADLTSCLACQGAVWLKKSSPAALSCSLNINIFISLFNYLKHFLCSIYFTQMEVGWAAPSLSKTCTSEAPRNVGHKVLHSSFSSASFTLTLAPSSPLPAPQTSCLKRNHERPHCSGPCGVQGALCHCRSLAACQRKADALKKPRSSVKLCWPLQASCLLAMYKT